MSETPKQDEKDLGAQGATEGVAAGSSAPDQLSHDGVRARVLAKGSGWCSFTHQHDNSRAALAVADETVTILNERITAKLTPDLNTGTAMDALAIVGEALREIRAEIGGATVVINANEWPTYFEKAFTKMRQPPKDTEASAYSTTPIEVVCAQCGKHNSYSESNPECMNCGARSGRVKRVNK